MSSPCDIFSLTKNAIADVFSEEITDRIVINLTSVFTIDLLTSVFPKSVRDTLVLILEDSLKHISKNDISSPKIEVNIKREIPFVILTILDNRDPQNQVSKSVLKMFKDTAYVFEGDVSADSSAGLNKVEVVIPYTCTL